MSSSSFPSYTNILGKYYIFWEIFHYFNFFLKFREFGVQFFILSFIMKKMFLITFFHFQRKAADLLHDTLYTSSEGTEDTEAQRNRKCQPPTRTTASGSHVAISLCIFHCLIFPKFSLIQSPAMLCSFHSFTEYSWLNRRGDADGSDLQHRQRTTVGPLSSLLYFCFINSFSYCCFRLVL